jgi:hypothetical protein
MINQFLKLVYLRKQQPTIYYLYYPRYIQVRARSTTKKLRHCHCLEITKEQGRKIRCGIESQLMIMARLRGFYLRRSKILIGEF